MLIALDDIALWTGHRGDYQQACEVDTATGIVHFGDHVRQRTAIVLWDEPLRTTYLPDHKAFVQWLYSDSEDELIQMVDSQIPLTVWEGGPSIEVRDRIVLFDAATPGVELISSESLAIQLECGIYRIRTADVESGNRQGARVHQLCRVSDLDRET